MVVGNPNEGARVIGMTNKKSNGSENPNEGAKVTGMTNQKWFPTTIPWCKVNKMCTLGVHFNLDVSVFVICWALHQEWVMETLIRVQKVTGMTNEKNVYIWVAFQFRCNGSGNPNEGARSNNQ
ncbi:hypothetical protein BJV77DRAFT_962675 [Russula vinacea]|nr:hypothetical protein BJV77DRAFT_962675 [Russula vinacea]